MELFAPDLFSNPVPQLAPARAAAAASLHSLLEQFYGHLGPPVGVVEQFGGAEINSKNFLVRSQEATVVAKCVDKPLREVSEVIAFAGWLKARGASVPRVVCSATGAFAVRHKGTTWYLLDWIEGQHFTGRGDQITAMGEGVRALTAVLERADQRPSRRLPLLGAQDGELIETLEGRRTEWPQLLGEDTSRLLAEHWLSLRDYTACVLGQLAAAAPKTGVMHIDLHPHNVLMPRTGRPVFLDLDSFQLCAPAVALAFGCLKLLRQAVCATGLQESSARRELACRLVDVVGADRAMVGLLARSEVLRRICILLRLCVEHADRSWNHVLPVHLRALAESRELFS